MTKRVIACLAALTLALSLLPVTALADELEVQTPNTTVEVSGGESGASQPEGTTTGGTEETGSTGGEGTGSGANPRRLPTSPRLARTSTRPWTRP